MAISISELTGIEASTYYEAKQFGKMKLCLLNGLITSTFAFLVTTLPIYLTFEPISDFLGIEEAAS